MAKEPGKITDKDVVNVRNLTAETQALFEAQDKVQKAANAYSALSDQILDSAKKRGPFAHQEHKVSRDLAKVLESQLSTEEKLDAVRLAQLDYVNAQHELGNKVDELYISQLKNLEKQVGAMRVIESSTMTSKEAMAQIKDSVKSQMEGISEIGTALAKGGPYAAAALAAGLLLKYVVDTAKATWDLSKAQGMTVGQSAKLVANAELAAKSNMLYGATQAEAVEAAVALNKQAGDLGNATAEATANAVELSVGWGLGANEAAKLQTVMKDVAGGTLEGSESMQEYVKGLAIANNVAPQAIMNDIAADTESFASFGQAGAEAFVQASIATKKLGIEMSSITTAAGNLLNIDDSISKQMEAEVYLGRQLNLEEARKAAFAGDYLTLTKELTSQVGSLEEFTGLSAVAQQSLADAVGLSVADTRKMITNQDKIANLSEEALQNYKETGEINEQSFMTTIAENAEMIIGLATAGTMLASLAMQWSMRKAILGTSIAQNKIEGTKTKGGGGGMMKMIGNLNPMSLIKGAAAMVIVAGAVFVFGKAVQEFMKVSWTAVGMAVVSMLALTGAVAALGFIMSSGVGALAIIAGAAAMVIVAAAVYVLGKALQEMAKAFDMMLPMTDSLLSLVMIIPGLVALAYTFGLLAVGISTMAASLLILTPVLPALLALGSLAPVVGALTGNASSDSPAATSSSDSVIEKLDELISVVKAGGAINLDGRKVGDVLTLARAPIGV